MPRWLIIAGIILLVTGVLLHLAPGIFKWFGKLPGDIRIEREGGKIFIPFTSMILVSIVLTILANLFRLLKK